MNWCNSSLIRTCPDIPLSSAAWTLGSGFENTFRCMMWRKARAWRESQSFFCMTLESITITGTHDWHVRSLTKTHIIIVAWRTTESNNTWYHRDSKINSSSEIVDECVNIWGAVREERWKKSKGLDTRTIHGVQCRAEEQIYRSAIYVTITFFYS